MIVSARQFESAAEMRAAAVAVRARCFNPKVKPAISTKPVEKVIAFDPVAKKPVRVMAKQVPSWEIIPTLFDEHVIAYRVMSHIREMEARGETELNYSHQRIVKQIVKDVLQGFPEFTISDIKGSGRHARICLARQTAIYEVRRQRPNLSYPAIGRWFGGRDHTTILHSVRKIEAMRGEA